MNPSLASLVCACGIATLFYLDRDTSARLSKGLWLPVIYLWIIGSRAVSVWLGMTPSSGANVQLEGSPLDAAVYGLLLAGAMIVVCGRANTRRFLTANWPTLLYFAYCLISISWAYYPGVAFKRWIKAVGEVAMVLVIVTEAQPFAALTRFVSRVGFILLPTSLFFIKYYGELGRGYTPDGMPMNTGVTLNKNSLGQIVLLVSLGVLWNLRSLVQDRTTRSRTRRLWAQGTLLAFGLTLLHMADSSTCVACFVLGAVVMLATGLPAMKAHPYRVHALCLGILIVGALMMSFGGLSMVTGALGRHSDFSGRTEIWQAVVSAVSNPLIGDGFENFWIGPNSAKVSRALAGWWHPDDLNSAHNGYLEVYANLGAIGVCLIAVVLIVAYRRSVSAFRVDSTVGSLTLAYIAVAAFYSIAEAGFRSPQPMTVFLILAVFSATGVAARLIRSEVPQPTEALRRRRDWFSCLDGEHVDGTAALSVVQRSRLRRH